ncbi:MAG: hypothetical protein ACOYK6_01140 [Chthoniobacterales bacterium]
MTVNNLNQNPSQPSYRNNPNYRITNPYSLSADYPEASEYKKFADNRENQGKVISGTTGNSIHSIFQVSTSEGRSTINNQKIIDDFKKVLRREYEDEAIVNYFAANHEQSALEHGLTPQILKHVFAQGVALYVRTPIGRFIPRSSEKHSLTTGDSRKTHEETIEKAVIQSRKQITDQFEQKIRHDYGFHGDLACRFFRTHFKQQALEHGLTEEMEKAVEDFVNQYSISHGRNVSWGDSRK